jgi:hypothetical protein
LSYIVLELFDGVHAESLSSRLARSCASLSDFLRVAQSHLRQAAVAEWTATFSPYVSFLSLAILPGDRFIFSKGRVRFPILTYVPTGFTLANGFASVITFIYPDITVLIEEVCQTCLKFVRSAIEFAMHRHCKEKGSRLYFLKLIREILPQRRVQEPDADVTIINLYETSW